MSAAQATAVSAVTRPDLAKLERQLRLSIKLMQRTRRRIARSMAVAASQSEPAASQSSDALAANRLGQKRRRGSGRKPILAA
jgi:hypothetical protein